MFTLIIFMFLLILHGSIEQKSSERIFGGSDAPIDAFPWMVAISFLDVGTSNRTIDVCGGSIVSEIFVITAVSCFFGLHTQYFNRFLVKAGVYNIFNSSEELVQIRAISDIIVHPNYDSRLLLNDIALVRISPPFNMTAFNLEVISLSNVTLVEDKNLVAIGWGILNQSNPTIAATSLQQITVQEDVNCTKNKMSNSTTQLCATGKKYLDN